ncbi:GAF domain-containing protein, partial [Candidatus Protofrankia californiensis]|uniref:GAF domain-containing protein n=1 Tax=Candidatus Protofrankia californiensis TaxID=1839754 RepID=UPI0013EC3F63
MLHVLGEEGLRRTLTLPPVTDSPRSARRFVIDTLHGRLHPDVVDTALLLVTELVTNVIVHAGTDATVDIRHNAGRLVVVVSDRHPVPLGGVPTTGTPGRAPGASGDPRRAAVDGPESLPAPADPGAIWRAPGTVDSGDVRDGGIENLREDGRGLSLVDALSTAWGTEHDRAGKRVWFRLDAPNSRHSDAMGAGGTDVDAARAGVRTASPDLPPAGLPAHESGSGSGALPVGAAGLRRPARLLSPALTHLLSAEEEVGELLAQLVDALPSSGAGLVRRPGRSREGAPEVVAAFGPTGSDRSARRIPLDSRDGIVGELLLWSPGLPVTTGAASIGVTSADAASTDIEERIQLVARWMALALGGAHLRRIEERRIGMLSFLAEASDLLTGSLDTDRSLALLARLPVPRLARWCTVHLLREDGAMKLAAVGHVNEAEAGDLSDWADDPAGSLAAHVQAALTDTVHVATVNGSPTVITAMRARRRVLGVVALGRDAGDNFEADEIELLTDLARRAAFAVDNARL